MLLIIFKAIGLYMFFGLTITFSWRWYEIKTIGEIQPDPFHSVIAMLTALSLMLNVILIGIARKKLN